MSTKTSVFLIVLGIVSVCNCSTHFETSCTWIDARSRDCTFVVTDHWDFFQFRRWLNDIKDSFDNVSLSLTCENGGSISLPFLMNAPNLQKISVRNCLIKDWFSEMMKHFNFPDTLKEVFIENCVTEVSTSLMQQFMQINFTKFNECMQETMERYVSRNNTNSIIVTEDIQWQSDTIIHNIQNLLENSHSRTNKCNFKNLVYYENSKKTLSFKYYFELEFKSAKFPKLSTLILRENQIPEIPVELKKWYVRFPALEFLDLSGNNLRYFEFDVPPSMDRKTGLRINLENNNISREPEDFHMYLNRSIPIVVLLSGNPVVAGR